ncbi:hypothetical protein GW915_14020 [bacterium]|nr:hypothetical protein [bacterium]
MERHGRQQLLAIDGHSSQKGQALVELLPAIVLFFTIIIAAFSYFKVMRSAVFRQEVVRNMAFAAIGNMGSMTSPPDQLGNAIGGSPQDTNPGMKGLGGERFLARSRQQFIGRDTQCFKVYPREAQRNIKTLLPSFFQDRTPEVSFVTYAVVQRLASGSCN